MSQDYATEVLLEPIIWIVDNFSGTLGPVSVHCGVQCNGLLQKWIFTETPLIRILFVLRGRFHFQFFVIVETLLISSIVVIAHLIGLPYYWQKSQFMTVFLVIIGYWLLINVLFHYYMAVLTPPGYPPPVSTIPHPSNLSPFCCSFFVFTEKFYL